MDRRNIFSIVLLVILVLGTTQGWTDDAAAKVKLLIITGSHGHDWKGTLPVLKDLFNATGRFDVDVTLVRLVAATGIVLSGGLGLLAYIIAWIIMPVDRGAPAFHSQTSTSAPVTS